MPLLRKILDAWNPVEANTPEWQAKGGFKIGDVIYISDHKWLVQSGAAILVDEETGEDTSLTGEFNCPICTFAGKELEELTIHLETHQKKTTIPTIAKENVPVKEYKCKKCDFVTGKVIEIAQHARLQHPSQVYVPPK